MNRILTYRPPRIALGLVTVSVLATYLSPPGTILHFPYPFWGLMLGMIGFVVMMWAWVSFRQVGTAVCPTEESTVLVTKGIYRFSRNPMYLGLLGMLLGTAFFLGNLVAFIAPVAFFLIIDKVFIPYEEDRLRKTFGVGYERYTSQSRRWL
jgi:protein-S-isoprenylcysteine O-methyltransferase Ste14